MSAKMRQNRTCGVGGEGTNEAEKGEMGNSKTESANTIQQRAIMPGVRLQPKEHQYYLKGPESEKLGERKSGRSLAGRNLKNLGRKNNRGSE